MPILQTLRSMLHCYYPVFNQPQGGVKIFFLKKPERSVTKVRTSRKGLGRETAFFEISGPSEGQADRQWKLQSLKLNTLDFLSRPRIILREATRSWSKLLYAERSKAGRILKVLVGADRGNIDRGNIARGGQVARPQTGERRHVSECGRRSGSQCSTHFSALI